MHEFELIRSYFNWPSANAHVLGPGDDCALVPGFAHPSREASSACKRWAVTQDLLIEGKHFFSDVDPAALGHKALAVNLSDLAACGAKPLYFLLGLALPKPQPHWLAAFQQGMRALATEHACDLIGGDTTATDGPIVISITAFGVVDVDRALLRSGAQPGDDIWVSGSLGGAAAALVHRRNADVLDTATVARCQARLERPTPRVALGQALAGLATSAIDVSDGLAQDLMHILVASNVAAHVDAQAVPHDPGLAALPRTQRYACILAGGDDYELCFTAAASDADTLNELSRTLALPLTRIGRIASHQTDTNTARLRLLDAAGQPIVLDSLGYTHFSDTEPS